MTNNNQKLEWRIWGGLIAVALILMAAYLARTLQERQLSGSQPRGVLSSVTDFSLTNQLGRTTTLADLKDHVWVADIIFTRCPGPCVQMTRRMRALQDAIPPEWPVRFLSLTTDPDYDTPDVLRGYAERFGAQPDRWWFLTGSKAELFRLAVTDLKLTLLDKPPEQQEGPNDLFIHSTLLVVVDKQGGLRAVFETLPRVSDDEEEGGALLAQSDIEETFHKTRQDIVGTVQALSRENGEPLLKALPAVNASLNGISALFLVAGYVLIRRGNKSAHRWCMMAALLASTLFLASYLVYHGFSGHTSFQNPAWFKPYYLSLLASHVLLAALIVPLVLITLRRALKERFDAHKKLARWTWPLWIYVSITGVVIYFLLYKIYPQS